MITVKCKYVKQELLWYVKIRFFITIIVFVFRQTLYDIYYIYCDKIKNKIDPVWYSFPTLLMQTYQHNEGCNDCAMSNNLMSLDLNFMKKNAWMWFHQDVCTPWYNFKALLVLFDIYFWHLLTCTLVWTHKTSLCYKINLT